MQGFCLLALFWVSDVGKIHVNGRHYDTGRDGIDTDVLPRASDKNRPQKLILDFARSVSIG